MERPARSRFNTQIHEEACEWFIECRAGDLDDAARAEFDRWLRKSPEHQRAYLEIAAIWNEGPTLDPAGRWTLETLVAQAAEDPGNIVALAPRAASHTSQSVLNKTATAGCATPGVPGSSGHAGGDTGPRRSVAPMARLLLFAVAASILLVTSAIAVYFFASSGVYTTGLGEQRSLALSDGSTVQLNSLSKIRIHYSEHERSVDLLRGQALFHVAKDTMRPFVVSSDQTRVRAVGTQFDVYRKSEGTVITVVEGRVAVFSSSPLPSAKGRDDRSPAARLVPAYSANLLAAGEQITVTPRAARRTPHPNLAGATAWTQRQLIFDSVSLADVADEFNRYNERKLVIDPAALGTLHISGVFSSTDPASLIHFLRDHLGLRVVETPAEIRVEKAAENIFPSR
jgi:transmembrane sensor